MFQVLNPLKVPSTAASRRRTSRLWATLAAALAERERVRCCSSMREPRVVYLGFFSCACVFIFPTHLCTVLQEGLNGDVHSTKVGWSSEQVKLKESGGRGEHNHRLYPIFFFLMFNLAEAEEDGHAASHGRAKRDRKTERQKAPTYYARREYNYLGDLKALWFMDESLALGVSERWSAV